MEGAILTGFCTASRYQFGRVAASNLRVSWRVNFAQPGDIEPVGTAFIGKMGRRHA